MLCPNCGTHEVRVKDSRPIQDHEMRRRYYRCTKCPTGFVTVEIHVSETHGASNPTNTLGKGNPWVELAGRVLENVPTVELAQVLADRVRLELG